MGWKLAVVVVLLASSGVTRAATTSSGKVDFNRDIRPILSDNCYKCHGPDAKQAKAGLRLDLPEIAVKPLKSGKIAVVPGQPRKSTLVQRITTKDKDEKMPPPETGKKLTPEQITLLRRWVEQGAAWQPHWAFIKPEKTTPPEVTDKGFARNEIDRFIAAKLKEKGLKPSPEAERVTLIRRLYFDLTGLPPQRDEVLAFVAEKSSDAYEKLVDRLLASPHYGERLTAYWLDLVRFADTRGYHGDQHLDMSLYRDYVISAFNDNKPFDQFTKEQIAGDLLPNATLTNRIASGYNRLLMTTEEGGAQAKEYLAKYSADRVRNASTVWLGATLGCAECHDHKFDPYKTKDYYRFAAFFADLKETAVGGQERTRIPSVVETDQLQKLEAQLAQTRQELVTQTPALDAAQAKWEASRVLWTVLKPSTAVTTNGATLTIQDTGAIQASGTNPTNATYTVTVKTKLKGITAFRLEALPNPALPKSGPGRADNGNFVLSEFELTITNESVKWAGATASASFTNTLVAGALDGDLKTGWGVQDQIGKTNYAIFETTTNLGTGDEITLTFQLRHQQGDKSALGLFRLSAITAPRPVPIVGSEYLPAEITDALTVAAVQRTPPQKQTLAVYHRSIDPSLAPVRARETDLQNQVNNVNNAMATTLVSVSVTPRTMRILPRGNWLDDSGEIVTPAVPAFLSLTEIKDRTANRLDLAQWLVSRDNPGTARVFVNRLWKIMFGQGIVKTLDDFGAQGAAPTHPQLLDWLAVEFMDRGWDIKHMLKLMAMSGTYRQTSFVSESLRQRDPYNLWLARQSRPRLEAEMVRDNALAISGLLARKVGGPSVKPYQPAGYWALLNFPTREYMNDHGDNLYRRGLYTYWARTFLHPSLLAFDAPTREECTVDRVKSNTPQQALVLLNDPIYVEAARVLAERMIREGGKDSSGRIQFAYLQAISRNPKKEEQKLLETLYQQHLAQYQADAKAAEELLQVGERAVAKDIDKAELAAWTSVARVVLNLSETITKY